MMRIFLIFILSCFLILPTAWAKSPMVNVYAWAGEIPSQIIQQFEKETGIRVNFSEYENNEIMYAKLRAIPHTGYDIVMPTSHLVNRMVSQQMLTPIDHRRLSRWKNINPDFLNPLYDPQCHYSVPFIWGVTGIFVNDAYHHPKNITRWQDLWKEQYHDQLLMLDDVRDLFSITLLTLGYSINDTNPMHIKEAYLKLKKLVPNVKVFSTDTVDSIMIDNDATLGMAWNGDVYKAWQENPHIRFIYPKEGFMIWIDSFAIPKDAPHLNEAYQFINFMLRSEIAKTIALETGYPIANQKGQALLPKDLKQNIMVYPPAALIKRGQFQLDLPTHVLQQYEEYWEELKMGG